MALKDELRELFHSLDLLTEGLEPPDFIKRLKSPSSTERTPPDGAPTVALKDVKP